MLQNARTNEDYDKTNSQLAKEYLSGTVLPQARAQLPRQLG